MRAGLGYRLHARPPDDGWVEPDSFAPNRVWPTGRKRRAGRRSAVKWIPDGTVLRRDNQWGIPRKHALFVTDGPDSTMSGSEILESHYDRPPEEGYSDIPNYGRPHDVHVAEELCSPSRQLEKAVVRLQQDISDYRTELKLNRTQTPAVSTRPPKRSGFTSTSVPRFSGSNIGRCLKPLYVRMVGTTSRQLCSCFLTWTGMPSTQLYWSRSLSRCCRDFW